MERQISANEEAEVNASNLKTVAEKGKDSLSEAAGDIAEFGTKALEQGYQTRIEQQIGRASCRESV